MFARISSPSATPLRGSISLRTVLAQVWTPALVLLAVLSSSSLSPGLAGSTPPRESPTPQQPIADHAKPIAWSELGSNATAQYSGPGLSIDTQPDGTIALRCLFQKLEGHLTSRGLSLFSTISPSHPDRFSITADSVGREGASAAALPETGSTHSDTTRARFVRPGLIEEYSVSADGVRQDFLLPTRPQGTGPLRLSLLVHGAHLQPKGSGVELVVNHSQRKVAYSKLAVTDANQQPLNARFEIVSSDRLDVVVEDSSAPLAPCASGLGIF